MVPVIDILYINCSARFRANIILRMNPVSYADYCKKNGNKFTIIEKEQQRKVYESAYYPDQKAETCQFLSPCIYIAELQNVIAHGGSGLVFSKELVLTDLCKNDVDNRVLYTSGSVKRGSKERFYIEASKKIDHVDSAVNLCGLAADNYYHLTFEILSRYAYVRKYLGNERVPVLLDEDARRYPQFVELTNYILRDEDIIYVKKNQQVMCSRLICPSMNTWMPMNVKNRSMFRMSDNLIAESAIHHIREATKDLFSQRTNRKIFLSRKNADISRIHNEKEVAELFVAHGFEIVCTEELSFEEQVKLFSSACCIAGASGAALTNLVYCNKGTVVGCFIPKQYEFCIYSSIANMVGCVTLFYDAKICKKSRYMSTEKSKVNLKECEKYISALEGRIDNAVI